MPGYIRGLDRSVAPSFVLLGWCTSLATMQCLFFALILQHPIPEHGRNKAARRWGPSAAQVLIPGVLTLLCVPRLAAETRVGWQNILQAVVMIAPVVGAGLLAVSLRKVFSV